MSQTAHLWEIDHPYYCTEGNYYKNGLHEKFGSWDQFAQPFTFSNDGTATGNMLYDFDDDWNFLYRWDWRRPDPDDYKYEREENPEFEMPGDTLQLYFMAQRKARCFSAEVSVTEADEPAVRAWLTKKAEHMRKVWEPLLGQPQPAEQENTDG